MTTTDEAGSIARHPSQGEHPMRLAQNVVDEFEADLWALGAEIVRLRQAVAEVASLHYEDDRACVTCMDEFEHLEMWPCPTADAIAGVL